jgi:hypothetical protein
MQRRGRISTDSVWTRLAAFAMALGAISLPAAGSTQIAGPFSGTSTAEYIGGDAIFEDIGRVGRCLAETKRAKSEAFIAAATGTPEEAAAYKQLIGRNTTCLADLTRLSTSRAILRGAIAEGLYELRYAAGAPVSSQLVAATEVPRSIIGQFADCYARAHPLEVHRLLTQTRIASKDEHAAFVRMAPGFSACLPAGRQVALRPTEIRLGLAEALYRATLVRQPALAGK